MNWIPAAEVDEMMKWEEPFQLKTRKPIAGLSFEHFLVFTDIFAMVLHPPTLNYSVTALVQASNLPAAAQQSPVCLTPAFPFSNHCIMPKRSF